jgi:hypothetical protein
MGQRLNLHNILISIVGSTNPLETRVYFLPPASVILKYPCIVYARNSKKELFANNALYFGKQRYSITVIDANPDSLIPEKVSQLPLTRFAQHFTADNLNHDVYFTYF